MITFPMSGTERTKSIEAALVVFTYVQAYKCGAPEGVAKIGEYSLGEKTSTIFL